jgi:DNA/RNA endonuclease YhcR with UshA esterase domain
MSRFAIAATIVVCCSAGLTSDVRAKAPASQPTTAPAIVDVTDKTALSGKEDQDVTLEGVVDSAAWSKSGQVMNVTFKDAADVMCVVFVKKRDAIDKAFGGNAADTWTGAKLHITGTLSKYTGRLKALKNKLQIIIDEPTQVKVLDASPTTAPSK